MRHTPFLLFCLAGALLPNRAAAQISPGANVHFTWNACDEAGDDLAYTGQSAARQVVSVSGFSGALSGFSVQISLAITTLSNPAWLCAIDFYDPDPLVLANHIQPVAGGPCPGIPGLQLNAMAFPCLTLECANALLITGTVSPPVVLDPNTQYALFEIDYDLAACAGTALSDPQCFAQVGNSMTDVPYSAEAQWLLSAQSSTGHADVCAGVVPARRATWGRLKSIYR